MDEQRMDEGQAVAGVEQIELAPAKANGALPKVGVIRPVASPEEVLAAWQQFQELKRSLLTLDDYQDVQGRARIKKSGWRKIAAAFGISDELLREERRERELSPGGSRYFIWEISVRAIAPNGRYADAVGSCASNERRFAHLDHDVRAVAHTRAKNRAVADLVGGGEVSAEELEGELFEQRQALGEAASRAVESGARSEAAGAPAAWDSDIATEGQLRAIRAHLRRIGRDEAAICTQQDVPTLEALSRRAASMLITSLARQPNAA
jgi:hypothetical protein